MLQDAIVGGLEVGSLRLNAIHVRQMVDQSPEQIVYFSHWVHMPIIRQCPSQLLRLLRRRSAQSHLSRCRGGASHLQLQFDRRSHRHGCHLAPGDHGLWHRIPHKPQRPRSLSRGDLECIRATIPHKPQHSSRSYGTYPKCIRATIPHKPQRGGDRILGHESVSERRFPTSHSPPERMLAQLLSVSERRFPTSHSGRPSGGGSIKSVSERRFPTSHSRCCLGGRQAEP